MIYLRLVLSLLLIHISASLEYRKDGPRSEGKKGGRFRIISGRKADIREFPYQASMEHYSQQWCGGSIIHKRVILTAAHCVQTIKDIYPIPLSVMRVRVGNSVSGVDGQIHSIERVVAHEMYLDNADVDEHDIAVLVLTIPVECSDAVKLIPFTDVEPEENAMGWVTGFGRQDPMKRSSNSRHLMAVEIPIMNRGECTAIHAEYGNTVTENMICAGGKSGTKDSCKGDSGGPLAVENVLVGVVAWGIGCGREGMPGVYTNVAKYTYWIKMKLDEVDKLYGKGKKSNGLYRMYSDRLF